MNNDSILINNYLQNEMGDEEKIAFEQRLANETHLRQELKMQQQIINAVVNAGIKAEFAKAIRKRVVVKRIITWATLVAAATVALILFLNVSNSVSPKEEPVETNYATNSQSPDISLPFINPPLPKINVPFSEYVFDADKGQTIYYNSGSIIHFPPAAFVDESNNIIKGMVKISYREFADPIDYFVSGIPMQYDSAGKKYNFESSGMCEINAYKDNKAVFVNPNAKPEINLSGTNKSALHNVYFLDTAKRSWEFKGKDIITEVKNIVLPKAIVQQIPSIEHNFNIPLKPIPPRKADEAHQSFSITVDPASFKELLVYDHLKFEVVDESTFKGSDANEEWQDVKLDRTSTEGIFTVTFANAKRKVTYKVRPVLEGKDYAAALNAFEEKNLAYEKALKDRLKNEKILSDSIALINKQPADNRNADWIWNQNMNAMINERNKKLRALTKINIPLIEKQVIAQQIMELDQLLLLNRNEWKAAADRSLSTEVIRSFAINKFGIWNCDEPEDVNNTSPVFANYSDSLNNKIVFLSVAVTYKGLNRIARFTAPGPIRIVPGQESMIWGIKDSLFYYFSYKDFAAAGIQRDIKSYTFKMRKVDKPVSSYEELRELAEKL